MEETSGKRADEHRSEAGVVSRPGPVNAARATPSPAHPQAPPGALQGLKPSRPRAMGHFGFVLAHALVGMSFGGLIAILGFGLLLVPGLLVGAVAGAATGLVRWSRRRDRGQAER